MFLFVTAITSCIGPDYPGPPKSSKESKEKGLLLATYKPSQNNVMIQGEEYTIKDAWASYSLKSNKTQEINTVMYDFFVNLENTKTKISSTPDIDYVKYKGEDYGYSLGTGITGSLMHVNFITEKKPTPPDTIVFEIQNFKESKTVYFIKNSTK